MRAENEKPADVAAGKSKQDEIELLLIREAVSVVVMAGLLLALSPPVQNWMKHQAWRIRQWQHRAADQEEQMLAELRRDISRIEHGEVGI